MSTLTHDRRTFLGNLDREAVGIAKSLPRESARPLELRRWNASAKWLPGPWRRVAPKRSSSGKNDAANELAVVNDFGVHVAHELHDFIDVPR